MQPGKLTIALLLVILCISVSFSRSVPPDMQRILDRGSLKVGMYYADIPPFFMHDDSGELIGVDVELARDIAQEMGVELELQRTARTFNELVLMLENHQVDMVISLLSRTLERAKTVRFTQPYIVLRPGLLINRLAASRAQNQSGYDWIFKSEGPVGVKAGTAYVSYAEQNFPNARIETFPEWEDVVDACVRGDVHFAYHDEIEVKKIIRDHPAIAIELKTAIISDMQDPIAMAVPWDSTHLLAWLQQYIDMHPVNTDVDQLLHKYMPKQ